MASPVQTINQINSTISELIRIGLSSDQNFPTLTEVERGVSRIAFKGSETLTLALKGSNYAELYRSFRSERAFSVLLPDGAMLQLTYEYRRQVLERSRLAFLPSPDLTSFESDPEVYLQDSLYADVLNPGVVPFPFRFDYDARQGVFKEKTHPKSHLTLGQIRRLQNTS